MTLDLRTRTVVATIVSAAALAPLAGCAGSETASPTAEPSAVTTTGTDGAPELSASPAGAGYEDGTYNAIGEYGGGPSYLDVTVTLTDSTITDVTVEPMAEDETSLGYQERFAAAVPDEVIGRSVDEVEIGRLAGSSSCGDGFNDAIAQIREQAVAEGAGER